MYEVVERFQVMKPANIVVENKTERDGSKGGFEQVIR